MESISVRSYLLKRVWNRRFIPEVPPFRQLSTVYQPATKLKKGLFLQSNSSSRWVPTRMYAEAWFHTSSPSFKNPSDTDKTNEGFLKNVKAAISKMRSTEDSARDVLLAIYGLQITEIKSMGLPEKNFHIKVSKNHLNPNIKEVSADGYTLKVETSFKSDLHGHFEAMHTAMMHLQKKGLRVPQPISTRDGKRGHIITVPKNDAIKIKSPLDIIGTQDLNLKCGIHLLTYIPGAPLSSISCTPEHFFQWGSLLARFHTSLEDLDCPALKSQLTIMDLKHFAAVSKYTKDLMEGSSYDDEAKEIIKGILETFPSEMERHRHDLPQGFLHGDFDEHNLLVQCKDSDKGNPVYTIDGILDFDEMHYGTYVWDLGMTLAHVLFAAKTVDPSEALRQTIDGYKSCRPLSDLELSLLKQCVAARLVMMTLILPIKNPNAAYSAKIAQLQTKIEMLKLLSTYFDRL